MVCLRHCACVQLQVSVVTKCTLRIKLIFINKHLTFWNSLPKLQMWRGVMITFIICVVVLLGNLEPSCALCKMAWRHLVFYHVCYWIDSDRTSELSNQWNNSSHEDGCKCYQDGHLLNALIFGWFHSLTWLALKADVSTWI